MRCTNAQRSVTNLAGLMRMDKAFSIAVAQWRVHDFITHATRFRLNLKASAR